MSEKKKKQKPKVRLIGVMRPYFTSTGLRDHSQPRVELTHLSDSQTPKQPAGREFPRKERC